MKYYIWALGCAMNKSDAERIASVFETAGFKAAKSETEADYILTVACSVRQHAIDRIYGKAREWQKRKKNENLVTILSGCVLDKDRATMSKFFDLIFDINNVSKLARFLEIKSSNCHSELDSESISKDLDSGSGSGMTNDFFGIHPKYNSSFQAYVPISTGCNNFCTYCAVPYTRGREISRLAKDIITEVKELIEKGYKEITLLGQNVNSYGHDLKNTSFAELLKEIDKIPGDWRGYFYSNHPKDFPDELIETLSKLKHFPHYIHLPLQSGSDKIIKTMNRHYSQERYLALVKKIRKAMPDAAITTDIIVGFPGETKEDFAETKKVMEIANFSMSYIAKFSPRPGTKAAKMEDDVPQTEKESRFRDLTEVQKKILEKENAKLLGKQLKILIDAEKKNKYYGRTENYKIIEIPKKQTARPPVAERRRNLLGQFVEVEIVENSAWLLKGALS